MTESPDESIEQTSEASHAEPESNQQRSSNTKGMRHARTKHDGAASCGLHLAPPLAALQNHHEEPPRGMHGKSPATRCDALRWHIVLLACTA